MKVLHVLDSFSFGGAENLIVELARYKPRDVQLRAASLASAGGGRDAMYARMVEVGLDPTYLGVDRLLDPWGCVRMARRLRELAPDVVHAHLGYSATLVPIASRMAGIGCVATLHHLPSDLPPGERLKEWLSVRVPARLGRLLFVSDSAQAEFARRYGPVRPTWRTVPNGVDLQRYEPRERSIRQRPQRWACVAALREPKGHLELLRAWRALLDRGTRAHLMIVGDGPQRSAIEECLMQLGLSEWVNLLGRCDDVPEMLAHVDGVVSASHTEALPTALIEAGAAGLPVVTTDAGGSSDVVTAETGWLVRVHDVAGLADALEQAMADPREAARRGAAARARVDALYSMPDWSDKLMDLYREVMRAPRVSPAGRTASV